MLFYKMSVDPSFNRNDATHTGAYATSVYALSATGGFTMERRFADIHQYMPTEPVHIDVTDADQIMMNVLLVLPGMRLSLTSGVLPTKSSKYLYIVLSFLCQHYSKNG